MKLIVLFFLLGTSAQALNHVVAVGNGGVTFTPNSVTAAVGDSIEFQFMAARHSVAQADFSSPCAPSNGGIWSGFQTGSTSSPPVFVISVTSTDPVWFYCAVADHCQLGMVFALNPTSGQTLAQFMAAAASATSNIAPSGNPRTGPTALTSVSMSVSGVATSTLGTMSSIEPATESYPESSSSASESYPESTGATSQAIASSKVSGAASPTATSTATTFASASTINTASILGVGLTLFLGILAAWGMH